MMRVALPWHGLTVTTARDAPSRNQAKHPHAGLARRVLATIRVWRRRAHERRQLLAMGERDLHDIGISSVDAWREVNKPLWRQ